MVPFPFLERTVVNGSEMRSFAPNALREDQHVSVGADDGTGERNGKMFGKKAPNKKPRLIRGTGAGGSIRPESSCVGIGITTAALLAMPFLAWLKRRESRRSGNAALATDAAQSAACAYLALITLTGTRSERILPRCVV
jgi:hypothetical protein